MTDDPEQPEPGPISWERVAAELAAADEDTADDPPWDDVAARLAASLSAPAPARQSQPGPPPDQPSGPDRSVGSDVPPEQSAGHGPEPDRSPGSAAGVRPAGPPAAPGGPPLGSLDEVQVEEADPALVPPDDEEPAADPWELRGGLEALLFVVDSPVDEGTLAATLRCTVEQVRDALVALGADYDARGAGISLRRVGEGWRLYTREEHAPVVERYLLDGQRSRLTQAALETLAVIAYRQPVTRARVSAIRGVGVDAVVRTLASRGLVYECGTDPDSGGGLYATTPLFLERLGLSGLDELPELGPLLPETRTLLDERRAARDTAPRETDF